MAFTLLDNEAAAYCYAPVPAYYRGINESGEFFDPHNDDYIHVHSPIGMGFVLNLNDDDLNRLFHKLITSKRGQTISSTIFREKNSTISLDDDTELSDRIKIIINELGISKSSIAFIFSISRQALYDWLEGKTAITRKGNLEKIERLEAFLAAIPQEYKGKINLWKDRRLNGQNYSLLDALAQPSIDPLELSGLLLHSIDAVTQHSQIASWSKKKNKAPIYGIYQPFKNDE